MKLWSLQPEEVARRLLNGEPYRCDSKLSYFYENDEGFRKAYDWLIGQMEVSIPKPAGVTLPAWAWFRHYGGYGKPDRRKLMFNNYPANNVIIELEVPDSDVLLSDFDDWHFVLNNWEIITDEEFEADEDREYSQEEIEATWPRVFSIETKEYVQACIWEILPEHVVKIHRLRKKKP